jgi:hypothetical protein
VNPLELLSEAELGNLLSGFSTSAFRFETRERYISTVGQEPFRKYLAGEPDDYQWHRWWMEMVSRDVAAGKTWRRVRIVSVPLSVYNQYSLKVARLGVQAGEDIRYLTREAAGQLGLEPYDAWLFDAQLLVHLLFNNDDTFRAAEIIRDDAILARHLEWQELAWGHAQPLEDFADAYS